jgi:hypothetical protein
MRNTPPPTPPTGPRRVRAAHDSRSASVRAAAAAPSRRQQSRWQREQSHQRMLYIAIGGLAAIIALIFGGAILYDNIVRANETVAQIGPDTITASQLLEEIRPAAKAMDTQARELGGGANIAQYVDQQKRSLPDQTINDLIDRHLIAQEAARRGLTITPTELDDKVRQTVADYQLATAPTPEPTATPEGAAEVTPTAIPTPASGITPTAVPTLGSDAYPAALQSLLDRNTLSEAELRTRLEQSMLRDKVSAAIGDEQVPNNPDPAAQTASQRQKAFSDWLGSRRASGDVKLQLSNGARDWVLSRIGVRP